MVVRETPLPEGGTHYEIFLGGGPEPPSTEEQYKKYLDEIETGYQSSLTDIGDMYDEQKAKIHASVQNIRLTPEQHTAYQEGLQELEDWREDNLSNLEDWKADEIKRAGEWEAEVAAGEVSLELQQAEFEAWAKPLWEGIQYHLGLMDVAASTGHPPPSRTYDLLHEGLIEYVSGLEMRGVEISEDIRTLMDELAYITRPLGTWEKMTGVTKEWREWGRQQGGFFQKLMSPQSPIGAAMMMLQDTEKTWGAILYGIGQVRPEIWKPVVIPAIAAILSPDIPTYEAEAPGWLKGEWGVATWTNPIYWIPVMGTAGMAVRGVPLAARLGAAAATIPGLGRYVMPVVFKGTLVGERVATAPFMLSGKAFNALSAPAKKKLMQLAEKHSTLAFVPDPHFIASVGGPEKFKALPKSVQLEHSMSRPISVEAHLASIQQSSEAWYARGLQKMPQRMQRPTEYINPQLLSKTPKELELLAETNPLLFGHQVAINGAALQGSVRGSLRGAQRVFRAALHEAVGRGEEKAKKVFGFERTTNPQTMLCKNLPDHPQGLSKAIGDVIENAEAWAKLLTEEQWEMIRAYRAYHNQILQIAEVNGIKFPFKRAGEYFHRLCLGPSEIAEGKITASIGARLGAKTKLQFERIFKSQGDGIKAGYRYASPMEAADDVWGQIIKQVSDKKTIEYWEKTINTWEKRVASRFPAETAARNQYNYVWRGIGQTEKTLLRAQRGERLTEATLKSVERYSPEIGAELRALVLGTPKLETRLAAGTQLNIGEVTAIAQARGYKMVTVKVDTRIAPQGYIYKFTKEGAETLTARTHKEAADLMRSFKPAEAIPKVTPAIAKPITQRAQIAKLLEQVKVHKAEITPARTQALRAYSKAVRLARRGTWEKVNLPPIDFPAFAGVLFPREVAIEITKRFGARPGWFLRQMVIAAQTLRMTKAALDLSAPFIQLMPIIGRHPLIWANAELRQIRVAMGRGYYDRYLIENFEAALELATHRGYLGSFEYFEIFPGMMRMMEKIPLAGRPAKFAMDQTFGRMEASFGFCGDYARIEMWKALKPGVESRIGMKYAVEETGRAWLHMSDAERASLLAKHSAELERELFNLATMFNKMTGVIDSTGLGIGIIQRQVESAFVFFAPRYTRAGLALVSDILRGGMTGAMAKKALGSMMAGGALYYYGVCKALGQEPVFDPTSAYWMTVEIGGRRVGVGGIHYAMLRLTGNIMGKVGEGDFVSLVSLLKIEDGKPSLNRWDNPFVNFLFNRTSPLTSGTYLMAIENNEYFGEPLESPVDYIKFIGEMFVPIWAETTFLEEQGFTWQTALSEFLGARTFPISPWKIREGLRELYALDEYDRDWKNLMPSEQDNLRRKHPDLVMWEDRARQRWAQWQEENAALWDEWDADRERFWDTRMASIQLAEDEFIYCLTTEGENCGATLRDKISDAGSAYGAQMDDLEANLKYAPIYELFAEPIDPEITYAPKIAYYEFLELIYDNPALEDAYGNYLWDVREQIEANFIEKWGKEIYDLVQQELGYGKVYPVAYKELQKARDILRPYWELPLGAARLEWREQNPDGDYFLWLFYDRAPYPREAEYELPEWAGGGSRPEVEGEPTTPTAPSPEEIEQCRAGVHAKYQGRRLTTAEYDRYQQELEACG